MLEHIYVYIFAISLQYTNAMRRFHTISGLGVDNLGGQTSDQRTDGSVLALTGANAGDQGRGLSHAESLTAVDTQAVLDHLAQILGQGSSTAGNVAERSEVVVVDHGVLGKGQGNGRDDEGVGDLVGLDVVEEGGQIELGHDDGGHSLQGLILFVMCTMGTCVVQKDVSSNRVAHLHSNVLLTYNNFEHGRRALEHKVGVHK